MAILNKLNSHIQVRKRAEQVAKNVKALQKNVMSKLTVEQLAAKTPYFKEKIAKGASLKSIQEEVYAVAAEMTKRILGLDPFPVQIMGAYVLNLGDVAEMRTGEGKTLTSVMPAYLNALSGRGVHVASVNEYLIQRDAEEMGMVHQALGLTVGINLAKMGKEAKRDAYSKDITYSVHAELGFDYLRDNMVESLDQKVQRGHNYAIVDEVDSILVDEARTPLIISSQAVEPAEVYIKPDEFVKGLKKDRDFEVDEESKGISLTPEGAERAEKRFKIDHLYDVRHTDLAHRINNALKANFVFDRDVEYMVGEDKVLLIDQFTGRVMDGRSYSYGLQQAIQAKEGVEIEKETRTSATITYQNFFRLYKKLSGMTGTAKTEEEEFLEVYNMRVVEIPTNKPIIRLDDKDLIFGNKEAKYIALVEKVKEFANNRRPVLLGTTTVSASEEVSKKLSKAGVVHNVLNAKNHNLEAHIIEKAGQLGAITISTNMAGRGTDIKIPKEVADMGGLVVLGTEKHESRRIDNQLRGRSGRQGDPGYSIFFISIEDDLMARFGGTMMKKIFSSLKNEAINSKALSRAILTTQKRIEGMNFESRKNVLDYDNVLSNQRKVMYKQRDNILGISDIKEVVGKLIGHVVRDFFDIFKKKEAQEEIIDYTKILQILQNRLIRPNTITLEKIENHTIEEVKAMIHNEVYQTYVDKRNPYEEETMTHIERTLIIRVLDQIWMHHIDSMDKLRQGIHLQSISQKNPIQLYIEKSHSLFEDTKKQIAHRCVLAIFASEISVERNQPQQINNNPNINIETQQPEPHQIDLTKQVQDQEMKTGKGNVPQTTSSAPSFGDGKPSGWISQNDSTENQDPGKGWT